MDGTSLGFGASAFDVVSAFEIIEHLDECGQERLLRECRRVLKSKGVLLLSTPNKEASGKRRMSADHKKELTREEASNLLINAGFTVSKVLGQGFFNRSISIDFFVGLGKLRW